MRKFKVILFAFLAITLLANGQNRTDSLLHCLQTVQNNEDRIKVLHQLIVEYKDADPDVVMQYGLKALGISRELEHAPQIALSLKHLGNVSYEQGQYKQTIDYYNEALELFKQKLT